MHEDSEDKEKAKYFSLSLWELCYRFIKKENFETTTSLQTN